MSIPPHFFEIRPTSLPSRRSLNVQILIHGLVIVISSLMAVVYIWRVVEVAYFGSAENGPATGATIAEAPLPLLLATWAAVALNFYFGFAASLPVELSTRAAGILLGHLP